MSEQQKLFEEALMAEIMKLLEGTLKAFGQPLPFKPSYVKLPAP